MSLLDGLLSGLLGYRYILVPVGTQYPYQIYFYYAEHHKAWATAKDRMDSLKEEVEGLTNTTDVKIVVFTGQEK